MKINPEKDQTISNLTDKDKTQGNRGVESITDLRSNMDQLSTEDLQEK